MNFISNAKLFLWTFTILFTVVIISHTRKLKPLYSYTPRSYDECNPLYWYPKHRPKYCDKKNVSSVDNFMLPLPVPIPVPQSPFLPAPFPAPMQFQPPYGQYGPYQNAMAYAERPQAGMVPGLPGMVSDDGGINIMPFSDVYADILERHKNKMVRRKLQRIIDRYEYSNRKYGKYLKDYDYY